LFLPEREATVAPALRAPFTWNRDALWRDLERQFLAARQLPTEQVRVAITANMLGAERIYSMLPEDAMDASDALLTSLETQLFALAPLVAAVPDQLGAYLNLTQRVRKRVKEFSASWDLQSEVARQTLYRLLYGSRAALEEALLQVPTDTVPALALAWDEPSQTPSAVLGGVRVHSGDILVSRGTAPTSALIARASDFPGNFSHVALVHVDATSAEVSVIEALIEHGVVVNSADHYLSDPKLRVMLLRPRADLPVLIKDPQAPHRAASHALRDALARAIPYDFAMDDKDHERLFCAEVASAAYEQVGMTLWQGRSRISSAGLARWLGALGVRHFDTQEPTDLEYDPQLRVVAEWRSLSGLFADHLDNAVTDALLETAQAGEPLRYTWYLLPVARILKMYSLAAQWCGGLGTIPAGMSATAALKHAQYTKTHIALHKDLEERVTRFMTAHGYRPPYWELVRLAREAREASTRNWD